MPLPVFLAAAMLALPPGVDPTLLPGADTRDAVEIELAGLAALYPGGVLHHPPQELQVANLGRFPKSVELLRNALNIYYVRVYDLKSSKSQLVEALASNPLLIVDFRYVVADAPDAEDFADALARAGLASVPVHAVGTGSTIHEPADLPAPVNPDKPAPLVLVLVNGQTAGPLEAWLTAFQETESVLAVGTPTAGQPGVYLPAPGHPDYYIISGELQPETGSVAGKGLQPRFAVEVTPEQNKLAYDRVESGTEVSTMLRRDHVTAAAAAIAPSPAPTNGTAASNTTPAASTTPATAASDVGDPVLQRAVDVVAALQVLGRVPLSKPAGTSKAADTSSGPARK